jgi:glycosyltransferase involved in cell wall biosynthesis
MAAVDIIIPLYNKEATVARSIQSVLDQTYADWRLIIVNDGSTDTGLAAVQRFTDPRIEIIEQENRGPGAARNRGIHEADAQYIAFLDADDQWYPPHLENAVNALEQDDVSLVGSMYEDHPHPGDMSAYWAEHNVLPGTYERQDRDRPKDVLSRLFFFHVGNSVVRAEAARRCGGFYDADKCRLGEDTVFFAKLVLNERFKVIAPVTVRHYRQDSDLSNLKHRPLDIFLQKPEIVLDYCSGESRAFAETVLGYHALRVAHFRARSGQKSEAIYLKEKFPHMRQFRGLYYKLCAEIALSRQLSLWVRFKGRIAAVLNQSETESGE